MGIFDRYSRRRRYGSKPGATASHTGPTHTTEHEMTTNTPHHRDKPHPKRPLFDKKSGYFNRRPSFGQWLKGTALDILTMVILGAIGLGVYFADPAPSRSFPVGYADGQIVYPEFAYPLRREIVPIWAAALLGALVPIFFFLVMQIRVRSFWDVNNAVLGLFYSLITAAVFQVFLKWLIGGLRPHFLTVCQPDVSIITQGGVGYGQIMFDRSVCTGDAKEINDSLESFPSGHSTAAFAGFMFLYFYLNAKLKVFSNHHPAMWKLVVTYMPVLGATLIAGALTIDKYHNWYDCLAGAIIGTVFAISAYRMVYASVWDFRFNHIPLTRHTPFSYGAGAPGAAGFETAVFSRSAGWGYDEAFGGAPFDAAHGLRGQPNPGIGGMHDHHRGRDSHRADDVEHNAVQSGVGTTTGTNRYKHHRKSLERKALTDQHHHNQYQNHDNTLHQDHNNTLHHQDHNNILHHQNRNDIPPHQNQNSIVHHQDHDGILHHQNHQDQHHQNYNHTQHHGPSPTHGDGYA